MDLTDRVAIVTGAGRGIGRGIATVMARCGATVAVADMNLDDASSVAVELADMGRESVALEADVTVQEEVDALAASVIDRFGRIDALVNNAGIIAAPGWEDREQPSEEDWDMLYEVNVKGVARVTEAVLPQMRERRFGKIVNIASVAGRVGSTTSAPYSISKAGVISYTQAIAIEEAKHDINVNAVCPGLLWTPLWRRIAVRHGVHRDEDKGMTAREVFDKYVKERTPLGREQTPEDIGNAVAFLASDAAKNITGQALNVSGGSHIN